MATTKKTESKKTSDCVGKKSNGAVSGTKSKTGTRCKKSENVK